MKDVILVKRAIRWKDKVCFRKAVEKGLFTPVNWPLHCMCIPIWSECKRCWLVNHLEIFWMKITFWEWRNPG